MPLGIGFARADGGVDTVTPVGTTLSGSPVLVAAVNVCAAAAGNVAVTLPQNASAPLMVFNPAGTATALTVFPPTAAGKISNGSAGAAFSVAQNKSAVFYPLPNGVDYVAVLSA